MTPDAEPSELIALLDVQLEERTGTRVSGSAAADEHDKLVAQGQVRLQNVKPGQAPPRAT